MPERSSAVFPLSVASGDPGVDCAALWTRVEPSPTCPVTVAWDVARDAGMRDIVASGHATAQAAHDWTVKVRVADPALEPFTTYWYRFRAFGVSSRIGRMRTLPAPDVTLDRLTLATVSCQDFTAGHFSALGRLADADVISPSWC